MNNPKITTVYDIDASRYHRENRRAIGAARSYVKEAKKTSAANDSVNRSFRGAASGVSAIDGPLGGISSRIGSVNSLLSSGAVLWAGLGAAIASAAYLAGSAVTEFAQVERQQLQMQALIKATGGAAGLSAKGLDEFARSLAQDTLASPAGVRDAINVMLTFKSVSGDTFKDSIRLSQDLASVMRTDVKSASQQLAKALEDPAKNLSTLSRSGVTFTEVEREKIKVMHESGDVAAAQTLILQKLESQVGGAGSAEGGGLIGKTDLLAQRWGEFKEAIVAASNADGPVSTFLDNLAKGLDNINSKLNPSEQDAFTALHNQFIELNEEIKKYEALGDDGLGTAGQFRLENLRAQSAALKEEIKSLQDQRIDEQKEELRLADQAEAYKAELADAAIARKEKAEAESAAREQAKIQAQNDRIVSLQNKKFERIKGAALAAFGDERAIEDARYAKVQEDLDREYALFESRGLLTAELESQFASAREKAAQTHAFAMGEIFKKEAEERVDAIKDGEEKIIDLRQRFAQIREERFAESGNSVAAEQARYSREQALLQQQFDLAVAGASKNEQLELERNFLSAKADLHAVHLEKIKENESGFTHSLADEFGIRLDLARLHKKGSVDQEKEQASETASFFRKGLDAKAQTSERWYKYQKTLQVMQIMQDTYAAATGAYKALVGIPYVGPVLAVGAAGTALAFGKAQAEAVLSQPMPSFDGGGYTGNGSRAGGVDGKGGFHSILHPQETVIDHTKNQALVDVKVTVINNTPARVTTTQNGNGVQLVIDEAKRQIAEDVQSGNGIGGLLDNRYGRRAA